MADRAELENEIQEFVLRGFEPAYGKRGESLSSLPVWQKVLSLGTELWLDTGSLEDSERLWCREFTALTTNNTLLNKEVQKGIYDKLIVEAYELLKKYPLDEKELVLEIGFVLNAYHGLRLVEKYDAFVSVEEHTDLSHDLEGGYEYAKRYYAICPERFIIKIPFTPAGVLATRKLSTEGVPVNHTLGFSSRQNYLVTRIARPAFVNVFLGRLNSFVVENELGDGAYVGEKVTLASQSAVSRLRQSLPLKTRQIAASLREGQQIPELLGVDVLTIPPKVAEEFLNLALPENSLRARTAEELNPALKDEAYALGLQKLWEVDESFISCVEELERENLDEFGPERLVSFFEKRGHRELFPRWSEDEVRRSAEEGKIPRIKNWADEVKRGRVGIDALMNLAGLEAFASDQSAMDERIRGVLAKAGRA